MPGPTPSQTVGPFFSMKLRGGNLVAGPKIEGERIRIVGQVFDGERALIEDALIELWQANAIGRYSTGGRASGFTGFGRAETDFSTGEYWFETIKPGRVPDPEGECQAPHLTLVVQARGMLRPVFTRLYFADEAEANESDLVMRMVPADRRQTLVADLVDESGPKIYRFDIKFQGDDETVFFAF